MNTWGLTDQEAEEWIGRAQQQNEIRNEVSMLRPDNSPPRKPSDMLDVESWIKLCIELGAWDPTEEDPSRAAFYARLDLWNAIEASQLEDLLADEAARSVGACWPYPSEPRSDLAVGYDQDSALD